MGWIALSSPREGARQLHLHYWQKPTGFTSSTANGLETVKLAATGTLDAAQSSRLAANERESALPAQLALKSIGYRSVPLDGVAFDEGRGIIPNRYAHARTDKAFGRQMLATTLWTH